MNTQSPEEDDSTFIAAKLNVKVPLAADITAVGQ